MKRPNRVPARRLHYSPAGRAPAAALASTLAELGEVVLMTCNAHLTVGEALHFPSVRVADDASWGHDATRSFFADFSGWRKLVPISAASPNGLTDGVEAHDGQGRPFHRILLTPQSRRESYARLLTLNQSGACPPDGGSTSWAHPPLPPWQVQLANRSAWLQTLPENMGRTVSPHILEQIFTWAQTVRLPVRTQVFHPSAIHAVSAQLHSVRLHEGWLQCNFPNGGFAVQLEGIAKLWLTVVNCTCCSLRKWSLEAYDEVGDAIGAWTCAQETRSRDWQRLLASAATLPS